MKILYTCFSNAWGGLEKYAVKLAGDQQRHGHDVLFVCRKGTATEKELGTANVPCRAYNYLKYIDIPLMWRLRRLIVNGGYRIVHAHHSQDLGAAVPAVLGLCNVKLFFSLHMIVPAPKKDAYHTFQYRRVEKIFALGLEGQRSAQRNLPIDPERVMELPYGMEIDKYRPGRNDALRKELGFADDDTVLGMLSRLEPLKGQFEAVRAMPAILEKYPRARLLMVGDETVNQYGREKKRIADEIEKLGLGDRVVTLPYRRDVPEILRCMDIFILPSHFESYSISVIEAKLTALPVVGAESGGVPQNLGYGKYGVLVKPKDPADLARGVIDVLNDPTTAQRKADEARNNALERYDQETIIATLQKEYRNALG